MRDIIRPGALPEHATVPLVIYDETGRRFIIGEATLDSERITAVLGDDLGDDVMKHIMQQHHGDISFGLALEGYIFPVPMLEEEQQAKILQFELKKDRNIHGKDD